MTTHTTKNADGELGYQRFHPPLIRLQDTAPNPLGRKILWTLVGLIGFLLIWAMTGKLDIIAVAEGRLVPASYLQIVQPSEAGIVREIVVREGERVGLGQVLMRMDTLAMDADLEAVTTDMARKRAQLARIDAEIGGKDFIPVDDLPHAVFSEALRQFEANRDALAAALSEEGARLTRTEREKGAALQQRTRLQAILPIYREQEAAFDRLVAEGFAGVLMAGDKRRERIEREQELATQEHLIASAEASIRQSREKLTQIRADYLRALHAERHEVQGVLDRLAQELVKQVHRRSLAELRAPQDGVIKDLATHTTGTVVQPGTVLATLVPENETLKAEVWLSNEDIGFVRPGQPVKLKFATYRFQKYGMGTGVVELVSADAQSEEEARERGQATVGGQPMRYRALVSLDQSSLELDGQRYSLAPGMHSSAEVVLGRRTVIEYLLSPIQKAWHEAGRER
ncbi:HlyD family type I secretion periplasmic adaptor subunit [Pseudothauera lacus]|uniref:Membrane fusion protein (MFP) family protein n=1 Tax=Pseudothauera lacus TaxID=2136175 RepID=A0A2T4IF94_9RHOO|nr:HlyD family type I secretion periplasmic adaptor subunit [Pseudothauera lacus]PTD96444.1 HlyD family type I secretion periplasmic adaptor subunit [Pseudothauera lacus]